MKKKTVCYISVNEIWSGSEVLWAASAKKMIGAGRSVLLFTYYNHHEIDCLQSLGAKRYQPPAKKTLARRILNFTFRKVTGKASHGDPFASWLLTSKPDLVVISQGNNISGREMMNLCHQHKFPYLTLTQLVTEFSWLFTDDKIISRLNVLYRTALSNYFVSKNNLRLNNLMLAETLPNAEVVYNPFHGASEYQDVYPSQEVFRAAIVGRLECMHKGLDLFLQVVSMNEWRNRNIVFTLYGTGPHHDWIVKYIAQHNLTNVFVAGYVNDVSMIWAQNHILLMPSRMEGQSLALVEAMYCHRCAIVTDVGGATEIVEDGVNGFVVVNPTKTDLNITMEKAWSLRSEWQKMGEAAGRSIRTNYPEDPVEYFNKKLQVYLDS